MPFFSGFANAIAGNLGQERADNAAKAERQASRENAVLQHLSTSDDPEIASMGISGLLDQTTGRKRKGLAGFLGEQEGNPALPTIRQLIAQGRPARAQPGSMAQPAGSPVQGAPLNVAAVEGGPVGPGSMGPPPPSPVGAAPARVAGGVQPAATGIQPRAVFLSPEERIRRNEEAQIGGKLTSFRNAMGQAQNPEEKELIRGLAGAPRRQIMGRPVTLEVSDGQGGSYTTAGTYDPSFQSYTDEDGNPVSDIIRIIPSTGGGRGPVPHGTKVQDPDSQTGWSMSYTDPTGKEVYRVKGATPYTPPPAFTGTATVENPEGGADVVRLPRGGGAPVPVGSRPAPAGAVSTGQAMAKGVVAAIDKEVAAQHIATLPEPKGARDKAVAKYNTKYGKKWSYDQWKAQAEMAGTAQGVEGGPPPPPGRGGKAPVKKPGGSDPHDPEGLRQFLKRP